jgi:flavin-dependent dehydrogenase
LRAKGHHVTLIEKEKFPRQKLCGEFISPECRAHFDELGVIKEMLAAGGASIAETVFYEIGGRGVAVPSSWFGHAGRALSLSRARMDQILLRRAESAGTRVLEGTVITGVQADGGRVTAVKTKTGTGENGEITADVFVDATGRHRVLSRSIEKKGGTSGPSASQKLVGLKVHLLGASVPRDRSEIYSFPGGYAGLSPIEDGLANLCMLVTGPTAKRFGHDRLIPDLVKQNRRAMETLPAAEPATEWLAVAVDRFGTKEPRAADNLFAVGDSAAFIDPFTGSGMLMALEGAKALAEAFASRTTDQIAAVYAASAADLFSRRLRVSSALRRAAFSPVTATATVRLLAASSALRRLLARSTRGRHSSK